MYTGLVEESRGLPHFTLGFLRFTLHGLLITVFTQSLNALSLLSVSLLLVDLRHI